MAGLKFNYPLSNRKLGDEPSYLSWHGLYTRLQNYLNLEFESTSIKPTTDEWEFGVSLRKKEKPFKVWFMNFERLGLAYRFSSSGSYEGFSFVFRSVYDR